MMLKNERLGTKTWRLPAALSILACGIAPFAGCIGGQEDEERGVRSQALVAPIDGLVISQVYGGGGGSSGSPTYQRDFIELFNRGPEAAPLGGLSVQYGSASGNFGSTAANVFALPAVTVEPGHYYLIGMPAGSAGQALDVDTQGTLTMGAADGKVALARAATALECGGSGTGQARCTADKVIDIVGYGTASDYEGPSTPSSSATGKLSTTTAALRKGDGCLDSNVNLSDFDIATPAPRRMTNTHECSADGGVADSGTDAEPSLDAGPAPDAEPPQDGGPIPEDAGPPDSGPIEDGGVFEDAGGPDSGTPTDAGTDASTDSGTDAGTPPGDGTGLVVSQIFTGGGNGSATFNRDYIELFNRSSGNISLAGLSVQYGAAAGDFASNAFTAPIVLPNVIVPKGGYFLVGLAAGDAGTGTGIPTPDVVGTANLSGTKGKVAIARVTTPLGCGATKCPATNVVDKVGYGDNTVTDWEGTSRAPAPADNATAIVRKDHGCQDSNSNDVDFATEKPASVPRNSASLAAPCTGGDAGTPTDAGRPDSGKPGTDSGTPPRNDGGSNGAMDSDSGCSCSTTGDKPMDKTLAFTMFGALGLVLTARRRRTSVPN